MTIELTFEIYWQAATCAISAQHIATTCCNTLHPTATQDASDAGVLTHCNTLQNTATDCNRLQQHTATYCNISCGACRCLAGVLVHCNTLQNTTMHCNNMLQHAATHCNTRCFECGCFNILQHSVEHCHNTL